MGAYTCQFGTVHKMCRCPIPHTIPCPTPAKCKAKPVTSDDDDELFEPHPYAFERGRLAGLREAATLIRAAGYDDMWVEPDVFLDRLQTVMRVLEQGGVK